MTKDDRTYGARSDQIHPFFKEKREWSKVKDKIVKDYITCYLRTPAPDRRTMLACYTHKAARQGAREPCRA